MRRREEEKWRNALQERTTIPRRERGEESGGMNGRAVGDGLRNVG